MTPGPDLAVVWHDMLGTNDLKLCLGQYNDEMYIQWDDTVKVSL